MMEIAIKIRVRLKNKKIWFDGRMQTSNMNKMTGDDTSTRKSQCRPRERDSKSTAGKQNKIVKTKNYEQITWSQICKIRVDLL